MGRVGRLLAAAVVVAVLVSGPVGGVVASEASAGGPAAEASGASPTAAAEATERPRAGTLAGATQQSADVVLTQEFRLTPERPGEVSVTHNYTLADRLASLRTTVPRRGTVTATDGFTADNETVYAWNGGTSTPSITYRLPVNETGTGDVAANGSLLFADVGEWALVRRPAVSTTWQAFGRDPVTFDRRTATIGPGAAGDSIVYLGAVQVHPRTVDGQTFRLAVPEAAALSTRPADVLDALERASREIDVGDRDEAVFAVAAPTEGVPWAVRGLSVGDSDVWVGADERLADPDNIWIHEYVHTRLDYETTAATRWTREGLATYYAARQALQHESLRFDRFTDSLAQGANPGGNVTLADPESWDNRTAYDRGAAVAAEIDRRVRLASDGEATLDDVVAAMNDDPDAVNGTELLDAVGEAGDDDARAAIAGAIRTDRSITTWNRSLYAAAFGGLPPRFQEAIPQNVGRGTVTIDGPYRTVTVTEPTPYTMVPGERLRLTATAENVGGSAGVHDVELVADDEVVDAASVELAPNETGTVELTFAPERLGEYRLGVGNDTVAVTVRRPAHASITAFRLSDGAVEQFDSLSAVVSLRNDAPVPGERTVTIARNGSTIVTETVRLAPRSRERLSVDVQFPSAGPVNVSVADVGTITVDVAPGARPETDPTPGQTTGSPTPTGDGVPLAAPIAAVLVIVAAVLLARYDRR